MDSWYQAERYDLRVGGRWVMLTSADGDGGIIERINRGRDRGVRRVRIVLERMKKPQC